MNRLLTIFVFGIILLSCKKESNAPIPMPSAPDAPKVKFTMVMDASATLQAAYIGTIKSENQIGTYTFYQGVAHAKFLNASNDPTTVRQISCEGHLMERDKDIYHTAGSEDYGVDFGSSVQWEITGKNDVPNFNYIMPYKVPEIGNVNIHDSINSRDSLWLKIDTESPFTIIGDFDTLKISIRGSQKEMSYLLNTANDSVGLSPSQLASFGKGNAYVFAEAILIHKKSHQGYPVAYVNKGLFYKRVWIY